MQTAMSFIEEEEPEDATLKQQQKQQPGRDGDTLQADNALETLENTNHDDSLVGDLDYKSAHLSSFLEAVRSAAQARNRGGSLLGVGAMSAARVAAEVGVPLQATFSVGGTAR